MPGHGREVAQARAPRDAGAHGRDLGPHLPGPGKDGRFPGQVNERRARGAACVVGDRISIRSACGPPGLDSPEHLVQQHLKPARRRAHALHLVVVPKVQRDRLLHRRQDGFALWFLRRGRFRHARQAHLALHLEIFGRGDARPDAAPTGAASVANIRKGASSRASAAADRP